MKTNVLRLLTDEELRLSIARAGWERVRSLKWDSNIRKLEATYERWCSEWREGAWNPQRHGIASGSEVV